MSKISLESQENTFMWIEDVIQFHLLVGMYFNVTFNIIGLYFFIQMSSSSFSS